MQLKQILEKLNLEVLVVGNLEEKEVSGVYVCDLLSNVMAHGHDGTLWITIQTHKNILAVANLLNFSGILLPEDLTPDAETLDKAVAEGITILKTSKSAFEVAGELYHMGLKG